MNIEHAYILYVDDVNSISYAEECKRSCEQYDIPYTLVQWYSLPKASTQEIFNNHNFYLNSRLNDPINASFFKAALCSTGHMFIWTKIMLEHKNAVAIFEHDAIVKGNIKNIDVEDNEIVFLGYRIDNANDYECLNYEYTKLPIKMFGGTHAYAITPNTSRNLLEKINNKDQFNTLCDHCQCDNLHLPVCSVDWWLGHNMLGLDKMTIVDPCPVVAVIGDRESYTQHQRDIAKYNLPSIYGMPPKFLQGLINKDKYFVDDNNFLRFR